MHNGSVLISHSSRGFFIKYAAWTRYKCRFWAFNALGGGVLVKRKTDSRMYPATNTTRHVRGLQLASTLIVILCSLTLFFSSKHGTDVVVYLEDFHCPNCNNFTFEYVIKNEFGCGSGEVYLLYAVVSSPEDFEERDVVRQTWGTIKRELGRNVRTFFFIGYHDNATDINSRLLEEQERHGDLVQGKYLDSYRTLTNKVAFALTWATDFCPQAEYIVKTDQDVFNNPYNYIKYLSERKDPDKRFVGGQCVTVNSKRGLHHKHFVPYSDYGYLYTPFYCKGGSYIMSKHAVLSMLEVAPNAKWHPMEDVFHVGLCRVLSKIKYTQVPGILRRRDGMTPCVMHKSVLSIHTASKSEDVRTLWNMFLSEGQCIPEYSWITLIFFVLFLSVWVVFISREWVRSSNSSLTPNGSRIMLEI